MLLQGDDGYYSREVDYEGTMFKIRELPDEAHLDVLRKREVLRKLVGLDGNAADLQEMILEADRRGAVMAPDEQQNILLAKRAVYDAIVVGGVVGWNISTAECDAENVVRLPSPAKTFLSLAIMADTTLSTGERDFLPPSERT